MNEATWAVYIGFGAKHVAVESNSNGITQQTVLRVAQLCGEEQDADRRVLRAVVTMLNKVPSQRSVIFYFRSGSVALGIHAKLATALQENGGKLPWGSENPMTDLWTLYAPHEATREIMAYDVSQFHMPPQLQHREVVVALEKAALAADVKGLH